MTPRRKVVVAIGLPGAGKSTYFERRGILPLSSDLIRELLYDDPGDQRHPEWVFSALRELLKRRLAAGAQTSYIDATNLTRYFRRPFIAMAREFGCDAVALYFDVPLEVCLERNRQRENSAAGRLGNARVVPEQAIRRMARRLEPATREEGFARVIVVRAARPAADPVASGSRSQKSHSRAKA